jgi:hypothetical protein
VGDEHRFVNYAVNDDKTYTFEFVDATGKKQVETYKRGEGRPLRNGDRRERKRP